MLFLIIKTCLQSSLPNQRMILPNPAHNGARAHSTHTPCDGREWYNNHERACGPVAVLVFKTGERGDEPRWWVRLPRALASLIDVVHQEMILKLMSSYQTDTVPSAEHVQILLLRNAGLVRRVDIAIEMTAFAREGALMALRQRFPTLTEHDIALLLAEQQYGALLIDKFRHAIASHES